MGCPTETNASSRTNVGAVLLAAGAGLRLGGRPKALLELGGVPLIRQQLLTFSAAGVDEVVVVTGHHAEAIETAVRAFPITIAHNPTPDDGQSTSVRVGLKALSPKLDAVIIALADQPMIGEQEITALIDAFNKRGGASMVVPRVSGQDGTSVPGNPVIIDAALRAEWLASSADLAGRKWRLAHLERVYWFDTDNPRYRIDIDTPEDLERFAATTGQRLQWPAGLIREAAG